MSDLRYIEYELTADLLCIGERVKKGVFKPCVKTIPFSAITGALRDCLDDSNVFAAGKLDGDYLTGIERFTHVHIYSPRYVFEDVAKVPLRIEFLSGVRGRVYVTMKDVPLEQFAAKHTQIEITMGAFKSKGFGRCRLRFLRLIDDQKPVVGELMTRIPIKHLPLFGIGQVMRPVYGYLFEPQDLTSGKYVQALFERSLVEGYDFLCREALR